MDILRSIGKQSGESVESVLVFWPPSFGLHVFFFVYQERECIVNVAEKDVLSCSSQVCYVKNCCRNAVSRDWTPRCYINFVLLLLLFCCCCCCYTHTHTHLMALCPGLPGWAGTRKVNQSGFYWSKRQWVAVESAGQYASLHLTPDR